MSEVYFGSVCETERELVRSGLLWHDEDLLLSFEARTLQSEAVDQL